MVSQITLGNFFNINGRNVLGGVGGSGLNTQALIAALAQTRGAGATLLQQKISQNGKITSALNEFKQLVSQFNIAANALRNPPGVANAADNAFAYTSSSISANKSVAGTTYLSIVAAPGTALQNYTISEISSLAQRLKQTTDSFLVADANTTGLVVESAPAAGQFQAGTFSVNGQDITLDTTDTLNSIAQKFNAVSANTGVGATVLKVTDGEFVLVFSSNQTGTANAVDLNDIGDTVIDDDNVLSQITITDTEPAANAVFKLDGITITRSKNTISDVVSGLTINLLQKTPDGEAPGEETEITVSISPDTQTAHNGIVGLINAYNDLKTFAAKQFKTNPDGTYAATAVLANNQLFRSTLATISSQLSAAVSGLVDGNPNNLTALGITATVVPATGDVPEVRGALALDSAELLTALSENFNAVRDLFQFTLNANNTNLRVFARTNALGVNDFTLYVNPTEVQTTSTITPTKASQTTSIINVADADTAVVFDSPTGDQLKSGSILLNGETITLVEGDTLNVVAGKFNAVSADSGVTARVEEVAPGQFQLVFTSNESALEDVDFELPGVDPDGVFDNFTFTTATGADAPIAFTTPTSGQFGLGTIFLNGQSIVVSEGDSLNDIVDAFNAVSGDSGVTATLEEVATGQFQIVFNSTVTESINVSLASPVVDPSGVFNNFTITAEGTFQATYDLGSGPVTVDLEATQISTGSGFKLVGPAGSALEGLELVYSSPLPADITVSVIQGLADRVYNSSYAVLKANTGSLAVELETIEDNDVKLNKDIARIEEQVIAYRDYLLVQFGALEQAISRVNLLLQGLEAQQQARQYASSF